MDRWYQMAAALAGESLALPVGDGPVRRFHRLEDADRLEALLALTFEVSTGSKHKRLRADAGFLEADTTQERARDAEA